MSYCWCMNAPCSCKHNEPQEAAPPEATGAPVTSKEAPGVPSCDSCGRPAIVGGLCCHDYPDCEPPRDSPELAAIRARLENHRSIAARSWSKTDALALLRMVDELTAKADLWYAAAVDAKAETQRLKRVIDCYDPHGPHPDLAPLTGERDDLRAKLAEEKEWGKLINERWTAEVEHARALQDKLAASEHACREHMAEADRELAKVYELEAKLAEAEALAAKNDARAKLLLADREAAEARVRELEAREQLRLDNDAEIWP